jgi:hypothetical protein
VKEQMSGRKFTKWICSASRLKFFFTFIALVFILKTSRAQNPDITQDEDAASALSAPDEHEEMLDEIKKHPLDINRCTAEELERLHILTPFQVEGIISHREKFGPFMDLLELQSVPGFDEKTISNLVPYLTCKPFLSDETKRLTNKKPEQMIAINYEQPLQRSQGFINRSLPGKAYNSFQGPDFKTAFRYRLKLGNKISAGLNAEKDAGEPFISRKIKGMDFYSAHLYIRDIGIIRQLALGDYKVSIGQGLATGNGFAVSKSIEVLQVRRYPDGIRPSRSMNESGFFRGAAANIGTKKFSAIAYASLLKTDGNAWIDDTLVTDEPKFYSASITGYHRTAKEIALKHTSTEKIAGLYIQTEMKHFHAGAGVLYHDAAAVSRMAHADLSYNHSNFNFFSEGAMMDNGGFGFLYGMMASLHRDCELVMLYRNYDEKFKNSLSNAFSNSSSCNESGVFTGLNLKLKKGFRFSSYADIFKSPSPRYRVNGPSEGTDYMAAVKYQCLRSLELELRCRIVNGEVNTSLPGEQVKYPGWEQRRILRFEWNYELSEALKIRMRIEQTGWRGEYSQAQKGNMVFQDISYSSPDKKWSVTLRYSFFNTTGSNATIYAFEHELPYSFNMVQLSGKGSEFYMMADYRINRSCTVWLRYSGIWYQDKESIGSGLDEIPGNRKETLKFAFRCNF